MKNSTAPIDHRPAAGFIQQSLIAGTLLAVSLFLSLVVSGLITQVTGNPTTPESKNRAGTDIRIEVTQSPAGIKAIWTLLLPKTAAKG